MGFTPAQLLSRAHYTQNKRLLRLQTPLGAHKLLAEKLSGSEAIDGTGFCLYLNALSDDAHIPLKSLQGKAVRLDIQTAGSELRSWHGHVTGFALIASNGGFARYRLRIEPWLAFLRWRRDSFLFQDKSVVDIADSLFADYQGSVQAQWRWHLAQDYPLRGSTTQFGESDLDFLTRLLAEEGIYYWFAHQAGGSDSSDLGSHRLTLADTASVHQPGMQQRIAYQRADVTEPFDTLQHWQAQSRLQTSALVRNSWDYRSVDARPLHASAEPLASALAPLVWSDDSGVYRWPSHAQGQRLIDNAAQALAARACVWHGESTVRTLAAASTFILDGHYAHENESEDERRFLVLQVEHRARNNFDEDFSQAVGAALGGEKKPTGNAAAELPFYRNRFTAIRAATQYRPLTHDGHGMLLHPKPTVHASQTALVVGAPDQPVHTDRDQRIKIQFHWQRGSSPSARGLQHPSGEDNAPAGAVLGAWVRVSGAVAGDNWGQMGAPRVGQEVLVDFIGGDIDRPVVVACVYNGEGAADHQANRQQVGAAGASGNAPAWFAGKEGEHGHAAVYSGIKTQELKTSQQGSNAGTGYNQLVFDATPGQERASLESTQAQSRLHLGALRAQNDNQRGSGRGHGAELASQAQGAVRGGAGVLISAHAQPQARGDLLAGKMAQEQLQNALDRTRSLAQSARVQNANLADEAAEPATTQASAAKDLPVAAALAHISEVLQATAQTTGTQSANIDGTQSVPSDGSAIRATEGGVGTVSAYSEPHLQLSAPQGIALATPKQAVLVNGATASSSAGQDIEVLAQGQLAIASAQGLSLYTVGNPAPDGDPNTESGIHLHAADGAVKLQSQQGPSHIAALKTVTLASSENQAQLLAAQHLLLTAGGAYLRLEGADIQIHAPGSVTFKAGMHEFVGPGSSSVSAQLPASELKGCAMQESSAASAGAGSTSR